MCIRAGADELETVKALMTMSLRAVVAEALSVEMDELSEESRLVEDLGMAPQQAAALADLIADTFDGTRVDLQADRSFGDLLRRVVLSEFEGVAGTEPAEPPQT